MKNTMKVLCVLLAAAMILSFAGCAKTEETQKAESGKVEAIKKAGKLIMGCSPDFPPYEFIDMTTGKDVIAGFDVELGKAIAEKLGVELEIQTTEFDGIVGALTTGNIDIGLSGMNITPERLEQVDFSDEYYYATQKLVIRKADAEKFKAIADFSGSKVGAQMGTTQKDLVESEFVAAGAEGLYQPMIETLVLELKMGNTDALVLDEPVAEAYVKLNDDLMITEIELPSEESGFGVAIQKGNSDLAEVINEVIAELKDNGKLDEFFVNAVELAAQQGE
jgi:ABC-type amino acid transport substrate-binding protein